jgi:hypothetical protein
MTALFFGPDLKPLVDRERAMQIVGEVLTGHVGLLTSAEKERCPWNPPHCV